MAAGAAAGRGTEFYRRNVITIQRLEHIDTCILDLQPSRLFINIGTNERINEANEAVKVLAQKHHARYIDINAPLKDAQGNLKAEYTIEGMHITEEGYRSIFPEFMKYAMESKWM